MMFVFVVVAVFCQANALHFFYDPYIPPEYYFEEPIAVIPEPVVIPPISPLLPPSPFTQCRKCMPKDCGLPRRPWDLSERLSGGKNSTDGRYPWHALIRVNGQLIGNGALISCNLVLTTAYILEKQNVSSLEVVLGTANANRIEPFNKYGVAKKTTYPKWNATISLFAWDIALLRLDREVDFDAANGYIGTICLPRARQLFTGLYSLTSFGVTLEGETNTVLQEARFMRANQSSCTMFINTEYTFCATGIDAALCFGDRGAPVVQQTTKEKRSVLVGINNDYQCRPGQPEVFTTVPYFVDWICQTKV